MECNKFKDLICKGRGNALIYLKSDSAKQYEDVILYACTRFTGLNLQSEGSNEEYFYEIISFCKNKDETVLKILNRLKRSKSFDNINKMFNILCLFAKDDSYLEKELQLLYRKYYDLSIINKDQEVINKYRDQVIWLFSNVCNISVASTKYALDLLLRMINEYPDLIELDDVLWDYENLIYLNEILNSDNYKDVIEFIRDKANKPVKEYVYKERNERKIELSEEEKGIINKLSLKVLNRASKYKLENLFLLYKDYIKLGNQPNFEILHYFYENLMCCVCRGNVVKIMIENNIITQEIIDECKYDILKRTRELVSTL